jgi:hypothetical protein
MTPVEKELFNNLSWAREQLNLFMALEKQISIYFGKYGFENFVFFRPSNLIVLSICTFLNIALMELWTQNVSHFLLIGAFIPFVGACYIKNTSKKLRKQNIFKTLGEQNKIATDLLSIIEMHVFSEQQRLSNIIDWRASKKKMTEKDIAKYKRLFDLKGWQDPIKAKKYCIYLGVLMLSLQRYLYQNRVFYNKHIGSYKKTSQKIDSVYNISNLPGAKKPKGPSVTSAFDGMNTEDFFEDTRSR